MRNAGLMSAAETDKKQLLQFSKQIEVFSSHLKAPDFICAEFN